MKLGKKDILITGLALLAMFLGAGNLIFPPKLGLQAGGSFWPAIFGFIITGVGLPLLGVTAVAKAGGDLELLANRVNPLFSKIITTIVILSIGPMLAIPRTAATTFEVGVAPFLGTTDPATVKMALAVTTLIFFLITLLFVLKPTKILDSVGSILTPFLILFLGIIIFKGISSPLGVASKATLVSPFTKGFLEGYNTMDALASVIFGLAIANSIKGKGIEDKKEVAKVTISAGIIAAIGLSAIYLGISYIGSTTGTLFTGDNPGQLLSFVVDSLLGSTGKLVLALTMALACLTTSIGLVASCGSFFNRLTKGKVSYNTICIITVLISAILANMGLSKILEVSAPLLVTVYPIIIVLVVISLFDGLFKGNRAVYIISITGTVILSLTNLIYSIGTNMGLNLNFIKNALSVLPLYDKGLEWIIPAFLLALVANFVKPSNSSHY
ncbi:branched-chain amino acid:cation transporter, LIVCS family [Desulfonispora thiosulfatigenes DSM 11270]|uniref:Branched-chain amino acid transport system carrier protein n=1 Tax=Desulfonispora thiosulfatigenes DSM 11270 TaxID=656914 RepID=A0A1W1VI38_DESTI|nr:branched-chain amino acid transport system II carrier protein [Desulfonispora thiosulfatigenes]SMB92890.1 branched-chain amino acid:cation transporter, LIVCS family [Desulfonispora thiosulfatigenes DSM 11270]